MCLFLLRNSKTCAIQLPPRPSVGQGAIVANAKNFGFLLKLRNCRIYPQHLVTFIVLPVMSTSDWL